ncbi:MAG: rod shape-determining protein [Lachnospiraceae bacterium]|nr:rod shape-determining protein [Lachnospiraceae bacterium]
MPKTDIGIDIGSVNIRVYVRDKGVIIGEPSIAAFDKDRDRFIAYGEEAAQIIAHASGNVVAVRPFKHGSISDYSVLEEMLRYFIQRAIGRRAVRKPYISICIPNSITNVEKRAIMEASYQAGAREVTMVPESVAAAIGAGIDITKPVGNLVVDIGGGSTDIALISIGSPVAETSIPVAGRTFDDSIMRYLRRKHSLYVNETEAERIKIGIGTAYKRPNTESLDVHGRNVITGLAATVTVTQEEVRQALQESTEKIVEAVHGVLERTPPELAADIVERGIVLTGGGALLEGLEERIGERTGINVMTAEKPEECVALGAGQYAEMISMLGK